MSSPSSPKRLCDYCAEHRADGSSACAGSKPYESYGAELCAGFNPAGTAKCCQCGAAGVELGVVLGRYLVCTECLKLIFDTSADNSLALAYDPKQAELTDLMVELEGLA